MTIVVLYLGMVIQSLTFPMEAGECRDLIAQQRGGFIELWQRQGLDAGKIVIECVEPDALVILTGEKA